MDHFVVKSVLFCFKCQLCSVSFQYFLCVKNLIFFPYRSLNVFEVMQVKCFVSCVLPVLIVALYTMSLLIHLFCSGHACLFLQLQFSGLMSCGWLFLIMRVLWLVIIDLTLLMQHAYLLYTKQQLIQATHRTESTTLVGLQTHLKSDTGIMLNLSLTKNIQTKRNF